MSTATLTSDADTTPPSTRAPDGHGLHLSTQPDTRRAVTFMSVMSLHEIRRPADLRTLSYDELDDLAGEIRDFVVQAVAENERPPRVEPRRRRADARAAPRVRLARSTRSCGTPATRPTCTRSSPVARPGSSGSARPNGLSGYPSREESPHDLDREQPRVARCCRTRTGWPSPATPAPTRAGTSSRSSATAR